MEQKDMTQKEKAHKELTDGIHEMFLKKNRDYGNSFENSLDEWGLLPSVIRIQEKLDRTKTSLKKELLVNDESVEDTFLDLANYAIMTVMWLEKQKRDKVENELGDSIPLPFDISKDKLKNSEILLSQSEEGW
nr:MAG TPA: Nucleotide modification associated domain 1 [Caudoviricetes sp.]